jgi:hypothetical protein
MLKDHMIRFPAIAEPQSFGEGEPAYGGRFPIDPKGEAVKLIEAAMLEAAKAKWEKDGEAVLAMLIENKKVAFEKKPYRSSKTGEIYNGFEDMFTLGSRTPSSKPRPSVFNKYGEPLIENGDFVNGATQSKVEQLIYDGCRVNAKIEIWAQDNNYGRRINCTLLGVMFAGEGQHFGGGSGPASAGDFADLAAKPADPLAEGADLL